MEDVSGDVEIG